MILKVGHHHRAIDSIVWIVWNLKYQEADKNQWQTEIQFAPEILFTANYLKMQALTLNIIDFYDYYYISWDYKSYTANLQGLC